MSPPARITAAMKRDALLSSPFFRRMQPAELDEVVAHASDRRVARGTRIFARGDAGSSMMAVLAGRIRIGNTGVDGREITHNEIGPGGIFGEIALLDGKPRTADAVAAEDSTLMVVERRHFLPLLMRHEGMVERLLVVLCDRLRRTTRTVQDMALLDMPGRLARVLCTLAEDAGTALPDGGTRIDLKPSQSDLGRVIGTSRESVNRQLKAWEAAGIMAQRDQRDGRYMVIRDAAALQRLFEG